MSINNSNILWSDSLDGFDNYCEDAYEYYLDDQEYSPYWDSDVTYDSAEAFQRDNWDSLWEDYLDNSTYSWEYLQEMIESQVIDNVLYAIGSYTTWRGTGSGYAEIEYKPGKLNPYDIDKSADSMTFWDDNGNISVTTYNHDGGMNATLYTVDSSYTAIKDKIGAGITDFVNKYFDTFQYYSYNKLSDRDVERWIIEEIADVALHGLFNTDNTMEAEDIEDIMSRYNITQDDVLVPIRVQ